MKKLDTTTFQTDWEYRQAQQQERKNDRKRRDARRGRKSQWTPKRADE